MFKKNHFILALFFSVVVFAQNPLPALSQNNDITSRFKQLSVNQLHDTANYYYNANIYDTALACYAFLIYLPIKGTNYQPEFRLSQAKFQVNCFHQRAKPLPISAQGTALCNAHNKLSPERAQYDLCE